MPQKPRVASNVAKRAVSDDVNHIMWCKDFSLEMIISLWYKCHFGINNTNRAYWKFLLGF